MRKIFSKALAGATAVVAYTLLATPAFAQTYYDYTPYTTTAADAGLGVFAIAMYVCICCVSLLVPAVIAYLVYKDATKLKIENAALWAVLSFFFTVLGVVVYILVPRAEALKKNEGKTTA